MVVEHSTLNGLKPGGMLMSSAAEYIQDRGGNPVTLTGVCPCEQKNVKPNLWIDVQAGSGQLCRSRLGVANVDETMF